MELTQIIAQELGIKTTQVKEAVNLLDGGNTIPFIARYRKEATQELDENVLRAIVERLDYLRRLEQRKIEAVRLIDEQGKLTEELSAQITAATVLQDVEDLYRPYKQKRRTRATIAKEKGLEPLATWLLVQYTRADPQAEAQKYLKAELEVNSTEDALAGAMDIIAETIADDAGLRKRIREETLRIADVVAVAVAKKAKER